MYCGTEMSNSLVVTGGEDRYLNVWQNSEQQVILQPAQSIWAVTILPNTDIVIGSRYVMILIDYLNYLDNSSEVPRLPKNCFYRLS